MNRSKVLLFALLGVVVVTPIAIWRWSSASALVVTDEEVRLDPTRPTQETTSLASPTAVQLSARTPQELPPQEQRKAQLVEQLLNDSGAQRQFEQMDQMADAIVKMSTTPQGPGLTPEQIEVLKNVAEETLNSRAMLEALQMELRQGLTLEELEQLTQIHQDPFIKRVSELENQGGEDIAQTEANYQNFLKQLEKRPASAERMDLIHEIETALDASGLTTDMVVGLQKSLIKGLGHAQSEDPIESSDELVKSIDEMRPQIKEQLREQVINAQLFAYRELENEEIKKLTHVYQRDEYKKFTMATMKSLQKTINQFGEQLGSELATLHAKSETESSLQ